MMSSGGVVPVLTPKRAAVASIPRSLASLFGLAEDRGLTKRRLPKPRVKASSCPPGFSGRHRTEVGC